MESILSWVGAALGALLVVAVAVAWWEHLVRSSRPPTSPEPVAPRAVSVDVQLDALPAAEATPAVAAVPVAPAAHSVQRSPGDAAQRRATLDSAMSRMVRAGQDGGAWTETTPMVLQAATETFPQDSAAAHAPSAGAGADSASTTSRA